MRTISILNFKGGTGKSTVAMHLAHGLALRGYMVVLVDCDMQANSSSLLKSEHRRAPTLSHVLCGQASLQAALRPARERLSIIPADANLNVAATYIAARRQAYYTLSRAIPPLEQSGCQFVLIDHAPGFSPITETALLASQELLLPVELEPFAVQAVFQTFAKLKEALTDHRLSTCGIVPCRVDQRYLIANRYLKELERTFGSLLTPQIRTDATISRAQSLQQTVFEYDPRCRAAKDFQRLTDSLLAVDPSRQPAASQKNQRG